MTPLLKKLTVGLILTVAVFAFFLLRSGTNDSETTDTPLSDSTVSQKSAQILADTARIKVFKVDDSLFSDESFQSLIDTRDEPMPVQTGRPNPFDDIE